MRQPPEKALTGRAPSSCRNPRPCSSCSGLPGRVVTREAVDGRVRGDHARLVVACFGRREGRLPVP